MPRTLRSRALALDLERRPFALLPSGRSVAVGLALAVSAAAAYVGARESSLFAVTALDVRGASPALAAEVRKALRPLVGASLLTLEPHDVDRLVLALPQIAAVTYDRAFPNALVLRVEAEQPLAVVRRGREAWLVSRRGRIVEKLAPQTQLALPRIWLTRTADVRLGGTLAEGGGAEGVAALNPVAEAGLGGHVVGVRTSSGRLVYRLRSGLDVRAGRPVNLALKLAVARRILQEAAVTGYLDVSVPSRPVALYNPQLSG